MFVVGWLVVVVPTMEPRRFLLTVRRPICTLPIIFFVLAVVGTLWSEARWSARLYAINPTAKLLVLPALIYHFHRSNRGAWVFIAFLASCMLLLAMSWIVAFEPRLTIKPIAEYGVPVKNYIDQSQEFALCAVALVYLSVKFLDQRRFLAGALFASLALSFVINMSFVVVSRTALFTTPLVLIIFALLHLKRRGLVLAVCISATLIGAAWFASPALRERAGSIISQYDLYKQSNEATSVGLRLEFWRK